jgi:Uma2 family endonuclease
MQATAEAAATRSKPPDGDEMAIRRITVAEYHRMGEAGIFGPEERVELLDGQLIAMPPGGPPHCYTVDRVTSAFHERFRGRAYFRAHGPMTLDRWSEPEPDVTLSALPEAQYAVAHPKPSQILLVVEVAVSSLRYDAGAKTPRVRAARRA